MQRCFLVMSYIYYVEGIPFLEANKFEWTDMPIFMDSNATSTDSNRSWNNIYVEQLYSFIMECRWYFTERRAKRDF